MLYKWTLRDFLKYKIARCVDQATTSLFYITTEGGWCGKCLIQIQYSLYAFLELLSILQQCKRWTGFSDLESDMSKTRCIKLPFRIPVECFGQDRTWIRRYVNSGNHSLEVIGMQKTAYSIENNRNNPKPKGDERGGIFLWMNFPIKILCGNWYFN